MGAACCRRSRPAAAQDGGDLLQDVDFFGEDLIKEFDSHRLVGPAPRASRLDSKGYKLVASPTGAVRRQLRTPSEELPALPPIE